ncbi:hypothetical protein [Vibrio phage Va2]|nr:hypothetical protein [Vibrio phage Va2]
MSLPKRVSTEIKKKTPLLFRLRKRNMKNRKSETKFDDIEFKK